MLSYHSLFCSFLLYVSVTGKAYEFFYPPPEKVENFPIWLSLLTFLSGKTFSYSMQYANALLLMYQNNKITYLNPFSEKWQRVFMDFLVAFQLTENVSFFEWYFVFSAFVSNSPDDTVQSLCGNIVLCVRMYWSYLFSAPKLLFIWLYIIYIN